MKDLLFRVVTDVHQALFRASKGRLLGRAGGMPVLVLTTIGRNSGRKRSTVLTAPVHDDERIVVVASYGGDDRHPDWYLNLRAHPEVRVRMAGVDRKMWARLATLEEKEALWRRVISAYGGYQRYQQKTARDIPLVILGPCEPSERNAGVRRPAGGSR